MKRRRWWIGGGVLLGLVAGWCLWSGMPNATAAQRDYLPAQLRTTTRIVIHDHPKVGGAVHATITDPKVIAAFVRATRVREVGPPCACFGFTEVEFHLASGACVSLNYKSDPTDCYIKYENPWHVQAFPTAQFRALVLRYGGR